jgi:hypothetical protein
MWHAPAALLKRWRAGKYLSALATAPLFLIHCHSVTIWSRRFSSHSQQIRLA